MSHVQKTRRPGAKRIARNTAAATAWLWFFIWANQITVVQAEAVVPAGRSAVDSEFRRELLDLADTCEKRHNAAAAAEIRSWYVSRNQGRQYLFVAGAEAVAGADRTAEKGPPDDRRSEASQPPWQREFMAIRRRQAARLWTLAEEALRRDRLESAFQLVYEIRHEDPQDERATRILGEPATGTVVPQRRRPIAPRRRDAQYGWPPRTYWRLRTPHFLISTNHSPQAATQLAVLLEQTEQVWRQLFVRLWSDRESLQRAFAGHTLPQPLPSRHHVVLFRNREEYLRRLQPLEPQIGMTTGIYRDKDRAAYFYMADESLEATWRHELVHQLFFELVNGDRRPGEAHNFWVVEGVALYLESLVSTGGYCTIGGFDAPRLQFARYRALNENLYVPLSELVALGRQQLQQDQRIRKLYSQSAGLMHFLMDGPDRYREAAVQLLGRVYRGTDSPQDIADLTGQPTTELDRKYRQFLNVDDQQLEQLQDRSQIQQLCLGHTAVTDRGLTHLADLRQLQWLDLAACDVGDAGVLSLPQAPLRQLNLEKTRVTDEGVRALLKYRGLQELDLSHTPITDEGLSAIGELQELRVLWLTGTQITDAGLQHVKGLARLRALDVSGTRVTANGWRSLKAVLPSLETTTFP